MLSLPIKKSLNKTPERTAPIPKIINGIIIIIGDSCVFSKEIFYYYIFREKLKNKSLQEYIAVKKAVIIPTEAAEYPTIECLR